MHMCWVYLSAICTWFLILFDTLYDKHNKKPISKRSERKEGGRDTIPINFLALDSFDNDILTRYVTSKWLAFNFGPFYILKKKKHFNIPLDIINAVKISLPNFIEVLFIHIKRIEWWKSDKILPPRSLGKGQFSICIVGVSPSLVSRYREGYSFWSTWGPYV